MMFFSIGWFNSTWRRTLAIVTIGYVGWQFAPSAPQEASSPSTSSTYTQPDESLPLISRLIARNTTPAAEWKRLGDRHLEQTLEKQQTKLLFQEAERSKMYRLKNPGYVDFDLISGAGGLSELTFVMDCS